MSRSKRSRFHALFCSMSLFMLSLPACGEKNGNCSAEVGKYDELALTPNLESFAAMHQLLAAMDEKHCSAERNKRGRIFAAYMLDLFKAKSITVEQAQFIRLTDFSDDPELLYEAAMQMKQSALLASSEQEAQKTYVQTVQTVERAMRAIDTNATRSLGQANALSQNLVRLSVTVRALAPEFITRGYRSVSASDQQSPIEFELNKTTFTTKGEGALQEMARTFGTAKAGEVLLLQGHTDITATAEHNCKLSQARAEAVRDALKQRGLDFEIAVQGLGESEAPLTTDNEGLSQAQIDQIARRVEAMWVPARDVAEISCPTEERASR